jgi:hypothetical protein
MGAIHSPGTRVTARYCGGVFTGTVVSSRHHTINPEAVEYRIAPDGPFDTTIGRLERPVVDVYAGHAGEPISFDRFDGFVHPLH